MERECIDCVNARGVKSLTGAPARTRPRLAVTAGHTELVLGARGMGVLLLRMLAADDFKTRSFAADDFTRLALSQTIHSLSTPT